jgi:hypothetical protein
VRNAEEEQVWMQAKKATSATSLMDDVLSSAAPLTTVEGSQPEGAPPKRRRSSIKAVTDSITVVASTPRRVMKKVMSGLSEVGDLLVETVDGKPRQLHDEDAEAVKNEVLKEAYFDQLMQDRQLRVKHEQLSA